MLKRSISKSILKLAKKYPVLTLTGPRQSGKTTLLRNLFPDYTYVNLENLRELNFASKDPEGFLARYSDGVIIDEIQNAPHLTSYIQVIVDERKKDAMFILTGSQNFSLIESVNQSLAGRTAIFELLPFSYEEIKDSKYHKEFKAKTSKKQIASVNEKLNIDKLMFKGFYPRIYDKNIPASDFYADYIKTYVERDLRQLKAIHNLSSFKKFLGLCAARIGQPLNLTNISSDLGVSSTTLKEWLSVLEASYIIYLLQPFSLNINKQLTKSPKLYFIDTGLLIYLLNINRPEDLFMHSLRGNIFENLIVIEILKRNLNQHLRPNIFFYKDRQHEVDLIYKTKKEGYAALEIKSASTYISEFQHSLQYLKKILGKDLTREGLIYTGTETYQLKELRINNIESLEII